MKLQQSQDQPPPPSSNYWGPTPTEDDYHTLHGVVGTRTFLVSPATGLTLFARAWRPLHTPPRAVVCMVHGYGNDTSWTFQSTPIHLARNGFLCLAIDLPGHGLSHGLRAFIPDIGPVLTDLLAFFDDPAFVPHDRLPRFLYGESMGGAICLLLHLRCPEKWAGAVLVAPMCKISDGIVPPWPVPQILSLVSRFAPTLACVPNADLLEKSVKVPEKKVVAGMNPQRYSGRPRLGTVMEFLRLTGELHGKLGEVTIPFLVVHGSADVVTDPEVSGELYEKASSKDKSIKIYDGMMHSLLFGEPDENVEMVLGDILAWLIQRSNNTNMDGDMQEQVEQQLHDEQESTKDEMAELS